MQPALSPAKQTILAVAEKAFAEHGIDGVSLRQISELAGQKNVVAAQYHFKTRDNIIASIIELNLRSLEAVREDLHRRMAIDFDRMSTRQLVRLVIQPFLELRNVEGQRTFCRFLRALLQHDPYYQLWRAAYVGAPFTDATYRGLRNSLPRLPDPIWEMRKTIIGKMIVNSVADYDNRAEHFLPGEDAFLADLIEMVTAALQAPAGE
jgi:AcrR family transcriptional regulator